MVIFFIGWWLAAKIGRIVENLMTGRKIDVTLSRFTGGTCKLILLGVVGIIALSTIGISVTPLIAALGAIGLGAGLAIQGMLSNYAAGFTIIITRPFVLGDTIKVQGVTGVVEKVMLPYTILTDEDNVLIQIPNKLIIGEVIHNSAAEMLISLDIGVAYSSNTQDVINIVQQAVLSVENIDPKRKPAIGIDSFADSSIQIGIRVWAPTTRHFETKYALNKAIHDALIKNRVEIPYPQREVRVLTD